MSREVNISASDHIAMVCNGIEREPEIVVGLAVHSKALHVKSWGKQVEWDVDEGKTREICQF